jgi:hypothetical protein
LRRVIAWWLFLLALSPFTAPFSTCDLSMLTNSDAVHARIAILSPLAGTLVDELVAQLYSPEGPVAGRTKFVVTTSSQSTPVKFAALDTASFVCRAVRCLAAAFPPGNAVSLRI